MKKKAPRGWVMSPHHVDNLPCLCTAQCTLQYKSKAKTNKQTNTLAPTSSHKSCNLWKCAHLPRGDILLKFILRQHSFCSNPVQSRTFASRGAALHTNYIKKSVEIFKLLQISFAKWQHEFCTDLVYSHIFASSLFLPLCLGVISHISSIYIS